MKGSQETVARAIAAGQAALERREFAAARELFRSACEHEPGLAAAWYGQALACGALGLAKDEIQCLESVLGCDPTHVPALIRLGDCRLQAADPRSATSYYDAATRIAANLRDLPEGLQRELARVSELRVRISQRFEQHLSGALAKFDLSSPDAQRFRHAVDLLLGKRQVFLQEPKHFYFPGLPQIEFYDAAQFAWTQGLEDRAGEIRNELQELLDAAGAQQCFEPYLRASPNRPRFSNPLLENPDWSACYLIRDGREVPQYASRCPTTLRALRDLPLCRIPQRTPSVLFSLLRPGTRIRPHHGYTNARLICHLPLVVPGNGALRVGNEKREWREGKLLVFDDSIEHEAWNLSASPRVVLLFDIWRPELSEKERQLVAAALGAVAELDGAAGTWAD